MRTLLLFVVAFVIGLVLTAPLERWLLPVIRDPLADAGAQLRVGELRFALPLGVRATDVSIDTPGGGVSLESFYVGLTRSFDATGCGGRLNGKLGGQSLELNLSGVDPSRCLRVGKLALESTLDGAISLDGIDLLGSAASPFQRARIDVTSEGGIFRGILEHAGKGGEDVPLGEWEFSDLVLRATVEDGEIKVEEGRTMTTGVEWEVLGGKLPSAASKNGLRIEFRARPVGDTPRARALIGLMPKAPADTGGWHNYRVTGSLAAPRVIGVE